MDYQALSYDLSRRLTSAYSTSFSLSSRLFSARIRPHIFAIYGMVRVADEIVDTFEGTKAQKEKLLSQFEADVQEAILTGYSTNPIVHSFAATARRYNIDSELIDPFFDSMKADLSPVTSTPKWYADYIYGSAEVIGLMCLKVFVDSNHEQYDELAPGARALGSGYQKVNFLRDIQSDVTVRGRSYFPGLEYEKMTDADVQSIVTDITADFATAKTAIDKLPKDARLAVRSSYEIYGTLLRKLGNSTVGNIKSGRIRISGLQKVACVVRATSHEIRL